MTAPWLAPLVTGIASAGGELFASNRNAQSSREQMRFQERMSSTVAQRSVADYTKAGLNPALAYDRPASSPGGASSITNNPAEKGINSALTAKSALANVKLIEAQTDKANAEALSARADADIKAGGTTPGEPTFRDEYMARRVAALRDLQYTGSRQPYELRGLELDNILKGASVNRAEFGSSLFSNARSLSDWINSSVRGSASSAAGAARGWSSAAESRIRGLAPRIATDWGKYQDSHPYIFKPRGSR